jgi:RNA polymerase sigma-70 factor (ECF subfamily)
MDFPVISRIGGKGVIARHGGPMLGSSREHDGSDCGGTRDSMDDPSSTNDVDERRLADLMIAYQQGDLDAFERLYALLVDGVRRYFAKVHRDRGAVHDLVQDTFLEMHRSRRTYTPPLPVRPWVFGIARNVLARSRRAAQLRPQALPASALEAALAIAAPTSGVPSADALDMAHALKRLPVGTRDPWLLHHVFGHSFDAIAARLGITVTAAKLRSSRATRALRLALHVTGRNDHE